MDRNPSRDFIKYKRNYVRGSLLILKHHRKESVSTMSSASFPLPTSLHNQRAQERAEPSFSNRAQTPGTSDAAKTCVSHAAAIWASTLFLTSLAYLVSIFPTTCAEESWWMEGGEGGVFRMVGDALSHCAPLPLPSSSLSYAVDDILENNHYWLNGGRCLCLPAYRESDEQFAVDFRCLR